MTTKHGIDTDALIEQFAQMSAKQADAARQAAREAVLKSLQGRELSISYGASRIRQWLIRNPWFTRVQEGVLGLVMLAIGVSILGSRDSLFPLLGVGAKR